MRVAGIAVNVRTPLKYLISSQAVENRDIGGMRAMLMSIGCQVYEENVAICAGCSPTVLLAACSVEYAAFLWTPINIFHRPMCHF